MNNRGFVVLLLILIIVPCSVRGKVVLKVGTIVPEKSGWMKGVYEVNKFIEEKTNGELKVVWYTSGVLGDEPEIIKKMDAGEIDGAGLSGLGLGIIASDVRIFELPFLFNSYKEIDYIRDRFKSYVVKIFQDKGYKFLGWVDQGFIYFFSKHKITTFQEISRKKGWIWKNDPLAEGVAGLFPEVIPVPIEIMKLKEALSGNKVDFFYFPPVGVIGFGLYEDIKYIVYPPIVYGIGGLILRKDRYDALPDYMKEAVMLAAERFFPQFIQDVRRESDEVIQALISHGMERITFSNDMVNEIKRRARKVYEDLGGKMYSLQLLGQVLNTLTIYRVEKEK